MGSIAITDRANGTGINATVTGLSGTGRLYVSGFAVDLASRAFTLARTFTQNETVTIALQNGPYFAVFADDAGIQTPISFRVTDGVLGVHERCLQSIRELVLSLALPGVPTDPSLHKTHKRPVRSRAEFGTQLEGLHYWKASETRQPSTNMSNTVIFPIEMVFLKGNSLSNISSDDWTMLRELIGKSFPRCPLANVNEVYEVRVVPGALYGTFDPAVPIDVQSLTFQCFAELPSIAGA